MTNNYENYNIYDIIFEMGLGDYDANLGYDEVMEILRQYKVTGNDGAIISACNREISRIRRLGIEEYNRECSLEETKQESYKLQENAPAYNTRYLKKALAIGTVAILLATGIELMINKNRNYDSSPVTRPAVTTRVPFELDPRYGRITYIVQPGDDNMSIVAEKLGLEEDDLNLAPGEDFYPFAGVKVDFYVPIDFANEYNYVNKENDEKELIFVYKLNPGESIDDIYTFAKKKYSSLYSGLSLDQFRKKILEENPRMFTKEYDTDAYMAGEYHIYSYITQEERENAYSRIPYVEDGEIVDYSDRQIDHHYSDSSDEEIGHKSVG